MPKWELAMLGIFVGKESPLKIYSQGKITEMAFPSEDEATTHLLSEGWEPFDTLVLGTTPGVVNIYPNDEITTSVMTMMAFKRPAQQS